MGAGLGGEKYVRRVTALRPVAAEAELTAFAETCTCSRDLHSSPCPLLLAFGSPFDERPELSCTGYAGPGRYVSIQSLGHLLGATYECCHVQCLCCRMLHVEARLPWSPVRRLCACYLRVQFSSYCTLVGSLEGCSDGRHESPAARAEPIIALATCR